MKKIILLTTTALLLTVNAADFKLGGRISLDAGFIDDSKDNYNDGEIRRFRVFIKGKFLERFKYEAEYDAVSNNSFKDMYIAYNILPNLNIKIGQTKEPFGLENLTSSKYSSFLEDSLLSTFSHKRRVGISLTNSYKCNAHNFTSSIGYFDKSIDDMIDDNPDSNTISSRLTYAYTPEKNSVYHIGFSASQSNFDKQKVKYKTKLNTHFYRGSVTKSKVKFADKTQRFQIESAIAYNSLSFEAEYGKNKIYALDDYNFDAWYAQIGYFLTGEHKKYKKRAAMFKSIKINKPFSYENGNFGAFELALRVSGIDLTQKSFIKKEELDTTIGLNWYLSNKLKVLTNFTNASIEGKDDEYSIASRLEYLF
jgi:phosphate-selective porin OprO/OprP